MGTHICGWGQRSHTKVKGHMRSSCKIGWKCQFGLIWKVEVRLEPNLVYGYNIRTLICSWGQRSHTKVKGHLKLSCKIGWKCQFGLIWKGEVRLEPNLVCGYIMGTLICWWGQRSHIKVKGHMRSNFPKLASFFLIAKARGIAWFREPVFLSVTSHEPLKVRWSIMPHLPLNPTFSQNYNFKLFNWRKS